MVARGRTSILREAMKSLLAQHKATGIEFSDIERRFGAVDRSKLIKLLNNMRLCCEAHHKLSDVGRTAIWFPGSADPDKVPNTISPVEWRQQQRARQADQEQPIVFYGSALKGGRCASVWEYAQHMRAATGAQA